MVMALRPGQGHCRCIWELLVHPVRLELLESHMPFFQAVLGDRLEYKLTFNDYSQVIQTKMT